MRRSAIAPTSAIATAIASQASATGSAWKLPPETSCSPVRRSSRDERASPREANTSGLSVTAFGLAHAAPARHGAAGRGRRRPPAAGSAGCTGPARGRRRPGASGGSRCRRAARGSSCATSICPGWPRSAWMRGSNGPSLPRAASTVSAPTTSAASSTGSNDSSACSASAVETCVPLISARPSLAASFSGAMPASRSACAAGRALAVDQHLAFADQRQRHVRERRQVARRADRALRRHVRHAGRRCAPRAACRSPPRARPNAPRARLAAFSASISRTTGGLSGAPTPTAVRADQVELQRSSCASSMRVVASLPKPVLTPYTAAVAVRRALHDGGAGADGVTRAAGRSRA